MVNAMEWLYSREGCNTKEKREKIKGLDISSRNLKGRFSRNLEGHLDLREFVSLEKLLCSKNQLTSLDVSGCKGLETLDCSENQLTSLDVSGCGELTSLNCSYNKLTSLDVSGCSGLTELDCSENQLTSLDVSQCSKLIELYTDDKLFTENKITGLEKTSIVRLDCRGGDLLQKSRDPKFIWEVFVRKYNAAFPEMELINIADLTEIAQQVNEETANNEEFLTKICPKEAKEFIIYHKGGYYYWILDQLSNTILARCLVIQNRLYEGKNIEYESYLGFLAQQHLKCNAMNPKNPTASLYENRKKLVNQALNGDFELLSRLQDLPYLNPGYKKIIELETDFTTKIQKLQQDNQVLLNDIHQYKQNIQELQRENQNLKTQIQNLTNKEANNENLATETERESKATTTLPDEQEEEIAKWDNIKINLELEKDLNRLANDGYWDKEIQTLHDDRLPSNKKQVALQTQRRSWLKNQQKQQTETRTEIAPRINNN